MSRALAAIFIGVLAGVPAPAADPTIDDFFNAFTAEWVRGNPNLATSARYFKGDEQDRLEQQIMPVGSAYQRTAARGLMPPRFIIRATLVQMNQFISTPPAQNPFVAVFAEKLRNIKSLSDARRTQLLSDAERIVAQQVYPAWRKAIALIEP